jgi:putative ABC transport system permease protein
MEVLIRGVKNVFRNTLRSAAVSLILTVVIAFGLVMLVSLQAVKSKVASVQSSIGTTITVTPAGSRGFAGGGEPITADNVTTLSKLANVTSVTGILNDQVQTDTTTTPPTGSTTNLQSSITAGTLGNRRGNQQRQFTSDGTGDATRPAPPAFGGTNADGSVRTFTLPIAVTGIDDPTNVTALGITSISLTSGSYYAPGDTAHDAVVGTAIATKNSLNVGSTFYLYGEKFTVKGIVDTGSDFTNGGVYVPVGVLQTLSGQAGDYTTAFVTANSIANLSSVQSAISSALGSDKVDVTSQLEQANAAIQPLQNIEGIALDSLVGALVAGAVIVFLTMLMIVRERRKEVGLLKAIGSSNLGVIGQFLTESLTVGLIGAVFGTVAGIFLSAPVLSKFLSSATSTATTTTAVVGGFAGRAGAFAGRLGGQLNTLRNFNDVKAAIGIQTFGYGLLIALAIVLIGTLIPVLLISRIRPAEVLRGE